MLAGRLFAGGGEFATASTALLATLSALGVLEHWMLVLPFSTTRLWSWSLRARAAHGA
jgi:putative photosynthetic complex assembly protein 2